MANINSSIMSVAGNHLGLEEYPGAANNPEVVEMFADSGHDWVKTDSTPWCAAFVGAVLAEVGLQGTGKLNARSYLDWGVATDNPVPGDVVVFWRGSRDGWQGHVGFFVRWDDEDIVVRGGNQGNRVSDATYKRSRLLGFRRVKEPRSNPAKSTTLQAVAATGTSGAAGIFAAWGQLDPDTQKILAIAGVVAILGLVWIARERLKKWAGGIR